MAKVKLTFGADNYRPDILRRIPKSELIKEYERLAKRANRSLRAIGKSKFRVTSTYLDWKDEFPDVKELSKKELVYKLSDVARYVSRETSTLSGLRRQEDRTIKKLHEHGYTFVNKRNFLKFSEFMEDIRQAYKDQKYDSERIAMVYEEMVTKKKISPEKVQKDFERHYNNTK